ncbi:hypothetical protein DSO57_1033485 [Entomophthora muscae]|uniref:Uncharacterized protein n=1 Tax=Entomophthora muscae TaxID=34485 RepID=A0ACC2RR24_9FUNG|nr:hypothetical protein DSO57_1033485 [Entomophthora muscae]
MSDPKRVYTKLEQSSLRLALGDSSLRSAIHCPQCHRLDAFNFNKLKNNNFGYRRESRTSLNGSVRPPGCGKTVASGYIHEAIFQLTGVISSPLTITLHEWLLRLPKSALPRQVLGCLVPLPHVAPLYAASQRTHQPLPLAALQPAKLLTRETLMPALLSVLLKLEHLDAENARQENSELHQLRTSPSVDDHVEEHIEDWADCMDEEDACGTPYHNFSPSPQYRPVLGVRHSMHATSAENVRSATLLQHRNPLYRELLLYKIHLCPVFWTCCSLKMLLCVPKLLTSQSSLPFFSLVRTSVLSLPSLSLPPRSLPQAPVPAPRLLSLVQQRLPLLCTMLHLKLKLPTNAPVSPMPRNLSHPSLTPQLRSF